MNEEDRDEETLLRSVALQNAQSIFLARKRAEEELVRAKEVLEQRSLELSESLAMMRATLEATADGIIVVDEEGRVTTYNEKFVKMWGVPPAVVETGQHGRLLASMGRCFAQGDAFVRRVREILDERPGESYDLLELTDGRVFERISRVQRDGDRTLGRVWSYRDITDRARYEADLREAKTAAEAASRSKSAFLATMSHELRTPLNAIAGYSEILELEIHGDLSERQRDTLRRIQKSQQHLLRLIDEILIHARLESGTVRYDLGEVDIQGPVRDAEALVLPQAWAKGLTLELEDVTAGLVAIADPDKLQQILVNLLTNAVTFTDAGGRVQVASESNSEQVRITVSDTGIGIPAELLESIFEPFVQVQSELTRTAGGSGLGLAISRALARGMGGNLNVSSELGVGSTFIVTLPAAARGASTQLAAPRPPRPR